MVIKDFLPAREWTDLTMSLVVQVGTAWRISGPPPAATGAFYSRRSRASPLWVPETLPTSLGLLIFHGEAAKALVSFDPGDLGRRVVGEWS